MKVPCILCGRVTERRLDDVWGLHAACEDVPLFDPHQSTPVYPQGFTPIHKG